MPPTGEGAAAEGTLPPTRPGIMKLWLNRYGRNLPLSSPGPCANAQMHGLLWIFKMRGQDVRYRCRRRAKPPQGSILLAVLVFQVIDNQGVGPASSVILEPPQDPLRTNLMP